ncbi:hypothetical protein [Roseivivax lentus]|uniref:hypothetical protein n=1 Tax=Roseivivax lentus TaxID=633194 RepID=UPI0009709D28|nr:hypothetical protein [Roseivivax lentus]
MISNLFVTTIPLRPAFEAIFDGYRTYYDPDWKNDEKVERRVEKNANKMGKKKFKKRMGGSGKLKVSDLSDRSG